MFNNKLVLCVLFLFLFLIPCPAHAGLSVVQAANVQCVAIGTTGCSITVTTTSGHLLVMFGYQDANSSLVPTFSDSQSQTYTALGSTQTIGTAVAEMVYKANSASVTSVKVTWNSGSNMTMALVLYEISGAATSNPADSNAANPASITNTNTGTSLTSAAISTSNANDILLYAVGENANTSGWTAGSSFTIQSGGSISSGRAAVQYEIVSSTQSSVTTSMSWTTTGSHRIGILGAFIAAATTTGCGTTIALTGVGC